MEEQTETNQERDSRHFEDETGIVGTATEATTRLNLKPSLFRRRLYLSDKPYVLERNQQNGERDLVELAGKSRRESCWLFYKGKNLWLHPPYNYFNELEKDTPSMSIEVNPDILINGERPSIFYHIHPDRISKVSMAHGLDLLAKEGSLLSEEAIRLANLYFETGTLFPSLADLEVAKEKRDYEWKIATSKGITAYECSQDAQLFNIHALLSENKDEYFKVLRNNGFNGCVQRMVQRINEKANDNFSVSFCQFL